MGLRGGCAPTSEWVALRSFLKKMLLSCCCASESSINLAWLGLLYKKEPS